MADIIAAVAAAGLLSLVPLVGQVAGIIGQMCVAANVIALSYVTIGYIKNRIDVNKYWNRIKGFKK